LENPSKPQLNAGLKKTKSTQKKIISLAALKISAKHSTLNYIIQFPAIFFPDTTECTFFDHTRNGTCISPGAAEHVAKSIELGAQSPFSFFVTCAT
jgi:hypothetical protein